MAGVTLDSSNTDHPADGFELPDSQTSGDYSWGSYNDETAINTAHVYDLANNGQEYHNCLDYYAGECREYAEEVIPASVLGNLYNWYTATAGTGTFGLVDGQAATGSICPTGWRLVGFTNDGGVTDFSTLLYLYGILDSPTSNYVSDSNVASKAFDIPVSIIRAGKYSGGIHDVGSDAVINSSMSNANTYNKAFSFSLNTINASGGTPKYLGNSLRCLAR